MVVLKDIIGKVAYEHFKLFICAIIILSSNHFKSYWEYAGDFLFVKGTLLKDFIV